MFDFFLCFTVVAYKSLSILYFMEVYIYLFQIKVASKCTYIWSVRETLRHIKSNAVFSERGLFLTKLQFHTGIQILLWLISTKCYQDRSYSSWEKTGILLFCQTCNDDLVSEAVPILRYCFAF